MEAGPNFYDDEAVFDMRHRLSTDVLTDTLEKPVLMELIRCVTDKRILDLGCCDAAIGRELLHRGAASYIGIEGSHKMAAVANLNLADTAGQIVTQKIENWTYPHTAFDLAIARLSLHYIAELAPIFTQIFHALTPGGLFVFSVEHPVIICSGDRGWTSVKFPSLHQDRIVDNYFTTGVRVVTYRLGGTVQKYHRTVEDYFHLLKEAGFIIEDLREARPQRDRFEDVQTYERRKRIPIFLILAARKSG